MFTQPKKVRKSARFLNNAVERNRNIRNIIIEMLNTNFLIYWIYSKKFRVIVDLIDGYFNIRVHSDNQQYKAFLCPEGIFNTRYMQEEDKNAPVTIMRAISLILRK